MRCVVLLVQHSVCLVSYRQPYAIIDTLGDYLAVCPPYMGKSRLLAGPPPGEQIQTRARMRNAACDAAEKIKGLDRTNNGCPMKPRHSGRTGQPRTNRGALIKTLVSGCFPKTIAA